MNDDNYRELAIYKVHIEGLPDRWAAFRRRRDDMLAQARRFGVVPEKATETIIGTLLTEVLDWTTHDLNWQLEYADLVVTRNYCKHLLIETKRPAALCRNRDAIIRAFEQARRYAAEQHVKTIAVSDGYILRALDVVDGGLQIRCTIALDDPTAPADSLWWISVHGIYRGPPAAVESDPYKPLTHEQVDQPVQLAASPEPTAELVHHKYHLPARCFAYVPDASNPATWKLPYRLANSEPDAKRLPKAIQCLLSNYRGAQVTGIPDESVPSIMRRLEVAAREVGKMPDQLVTTASSYQMLAAALTQLPSAAAALSAKGTT